MSGDHVLRTFGLTKRFGRTIAVDRIDLEIERGQIYGFLGRNGAGKTTTIRMLMGITKLTSGEIEWFGDRRSRPPVEVKRRIGYVSQNQTFYPWMTAERLGKFVAGFYPGWNHAEFLRLLHLLYVPADRKVGALSQGMKVKLALAIALAHGPELLILDEPTAGLDPAARREFLELVGSQAKSAGRTTFFSSHLVDEVERIADRVGIINYGRLHYQGSQAALQRSVRRVDLPAEVSPPIDFEVLSRQEEGDQVRWVLRGSELHWDTAPFAPGAVAHLSLEDIFLAIAIGRVAEL